MVASIFWAICLGTARCFAQQAVPQDDNRFGQGELRIIAGDYNTGYIMREDRLVDGDDKRAYALIGPVGRRIYGRRFLFQNGGLQIQPEIRTGTKEQATQPIGNAGLLVILPPGDGNRDRAIELWAEVMQSVLKGRYYIAVAQVPHWDGPSPALWLTEANVKQVRGARFSTEMLVTDIVHDVSLRYNIDPKRTFLLGAAESGLATYACSLSKKNPFSGFYIHDSPFRTAQLPPFTHVRGRRFFLQQVQEDKNSPMWMAEVARKMLTERGATVKLTSYHGTGPYRFPDKSWSPIVEAITWLENSKTP